MASNKAKQIGVTNEEMAKRSANSKKIVNTDLKVKMTTKENQNREYYCTCCGRHWTKQKDNFSASRSPLYKSNNGYVHICKDCTAEYYRQMVDLFDGNEEHAIERMCQIFDWLYHELPLGMSRQISEDRPRVHDYVNKIYMNQSKSIPNNDYTYVTTIKNKNTIAASDINTDTLSRKEIEKLEKNKKTWGVDYSQEEYDTLNNHYKMLTQHIESMDFVQETLIRDLCDIKVQQIRSRKNNELDKYSKLIELYQKTLSSAKLKPNTGSLIDEVNDCYGSWLNDIEQFTPAEFYKDKDKYRDFFGIREYTERFMFRPLKNLLTGSKEMDNEFVIKDDSEGDANG